MMTMRKITDKIIYYNMSKIRCLMILEIKHYYSRWNHTTRTKHFSLTSRTASIFTI
jgi:hypothetical protein